VTAGGVAIIASILGILLFILVEIWPLLGGADVAPGPGFDVPPRAAGAVLSDEFRSHIAVLGLDGHLRVFDAGGQLVFERDVLVRDEEPTPDAVDETASSPEIVRTRSAGLDRVATAPGRPLLTGSTVDGRVVLVPVGWEVTFDEQERVVTPRVAEPILFAIDPARGRLSAFAAAIDEDGAASVAAQLADGTIVVVKRDVEENLFSGEITESFARHETPFSTTLTTLVMDAAQQNLYGGTAGGDLVWWRLRGGEPGNPSVISGASPITTLSLLIGDRSLIVGRDDGSLQVWFPVRQPEGGVELTQIREFDALEGAVRSISPSPRNKGFLAQDDNGTLGLFYSTSHRVLWTGASPVSDPEGLYFTPKSNGAFLSGEGRIASLDIENPHPEIGFRALFGKVWYEGREEPEYVWQSTGGTDDFEPKLSLTPLMIGTLKGTIYSLFLAIPLGVLGAMYTSQFMHPSLKKVVKPTVEIMAALPSVVLGFLAGLWLAPRVSRILPALGLMLVVLPLLVLAAGLLWQKVPSRLRNRFAAGTEAAIYFVVLGLGIGLCLALNGAVENLLFGGDFTEWLLAVTGLQYDQRNAVVVGLAMGFAVIPIIFAIAEDAFSNVPRDLVAGSLALGANRWQTVTRVVLPTASPGIFSAIMVGFGRAVGETMIVLMATGNTPIMDWNPFNGFRTLSANIAVEIPEAPQGATLYRTLFLAALLLFILTFVINTVAEIVRQRLRKRYSEI
jgi:phosphate transport system permease protein